MYTIYIGFVMAIHCCFCFVCSVLDHEQPQRHKIDKNPMYFDFLVACMERGEHFDRFQPKTWLIMDCFVLVL